MLVDMMKDLRAMQERMFERFDYIEPIYNVYEIIDIDEFNTMANKFSINMRYRKESILAFNDNIGEIKSMDKEYFRDLQVLTLGELLDEIVKNPSLEQKLSKREKELAMRYFDLIWIGCEE